MPRKKGDFNKTDYVVGYIKEHYKRIEIRINMENELDILEHLIKQSNMQQYIKSLIRNDMAK